MKFLFVIASIALTVLSWGMYGPVLHRGQQDMDHTRLLPFFFVGVAYFFIAVAVPAVLLRTRGESGRWTTGGGFWSLLAGAAGALGALGIILAFESGGSPFFVMPIVFGGAPIVNSLITARMNRLTSEIGPVFIAGLMMVILGAVTVLIFKPSSSPTGGASDSVQWIWLISAITGTVLCWGAYGPFLHRGQMKMQGSRLRPLLCVGLAYFAIAVVVPTMLLSGGLDGGWGAFRISGTCWSLAAGAAGVLGSLGIIMAFNWGGKPIYVMPLVFGGAPVINTFWTIIRRTDGSSISPFFWAGLILVIGGSALVLVFSPKGNTGPTKSPSPKKETPRPNASPTETLSEEQPDKVAYDAEPADSQQVQDAAAPPKQLHDEHPHSD